MKRLLLFIGLISFYFTVKSQQYDVNGDYKINGKLGIGTDNPNSKFEVEVRHDYDQDEEMRIGSYYQNKFYGLGLNYRINSTGAVSKHFVEYS